MAPPRIRPDDGRAAVIAVREKIAAGRVADAVGVSRPQLATAVRYLLQVLATAHPGHTVEVRVPPFGAVQCVEGPRHTRGTPANVVEMDAATWVALATGSLAWADALADARVDASGNRADLSALVPLQEW
ncbi:MAG: hypothetical protein F2808_01615 [Actinobacteria bacterium]|uniref:Unannotated protein n=1 Tax=freshwater metagenome TaxID=449393 RepID=A0A6J7FFI3_9ZZZZ|nr:hypothetical protein [Actinomycetota bacterium]